MNKNIKTINPLIFSKKINNKHKVIPLNLTVNTLGSVKHFPPSTREWFNSIYAYNNNTIKNLSIADKNLSRLIKSYFNFYFNKNVLDSKRIPMRFRRLAMKKIFVSKAEIKHTSSKVIITLYVYNEEKRFLLRRIKYLASYIFPSNFIINFKNIWKIDRPMHFIEKYNELYKEYHKTSVLNWILNNAVSYLKSLMAERNNYVKINKRKTSLILQNIANRKNLIKGLEQWLNLVSISITPLTNYAYLDNFYLRYLRLVYFSKEFKVINYYNLLLNLNKAKFKDFFISRLSPLISKIYNGKDVQFNIVNLKTLYFNSDIFTQAIALKLKNRDNKLIRVLKSALFLVKLPKVNIIRERYHSIAIKQIWGNKVKNFKINSLLNMPNNNEDTLNVIISKVFGDSAFANENRNSNKFNDKSILDFILSSLKHKNMAGVRLEAKGRLTRRFTASRSVFKIRWKGGIRNIDSSYRGLSTVLLRGHLKSNIQYSVLNSKTRNGAFGVKGWVSSK